MQDDSSDDRMPSTIILFCLIHCCLLNPQGPKSDSSSSLSMGHLSVDGELVSLLDKLNGFKDVQIVIGEDSWQDLQGRKWTIPFCSIPTFCKILKILITPPPKRSGLFNFPSSVDGLPEKELQKYLTKDAVAAKAIDTSQRRYGSPSWYYCRNDGPRLVSTLSGLPDLTSLVRPMFFEIKRPGQVCRSQEVVYSFTRDFC